ncbi:hypothetical protein DSO57_1009930 [Entomophthora muscae]|uniref:Uncharacterized protein n=1 Tax=Entomophthora muscae TaxID=34485 RepID=A0ACC2SVJ0_9FUNG|nr:hypothetical protein DSO57_1009930 [Entomophthora muscae]
MTFWHVIALTSNQLVIAQSELAKLDVPADAPRHRQPKQKPKSKARPRSPSETEHARTTRKQNAKDWPRLAETPKTGKREREEPQN